MMSGLRGTPRTSSKEGARPEGLQGAESWVVTGAGPEGGKEAREEKGGSVGPGSGQ